MECRWSADGVTPEGLGDRGKQEGTACRGLLHCVEECGHYIEWKEKTSRVFK